MSVYFRNNKWFDQPLVVRQGDQFLNRLVFLIAGFVIAVVFQIGR